MSDYLSLDEILRIAKMKCHCSFKQVPHDKTVYQGRKDNWETVTLVVKRAKISIQGFYYADITLKQSEIFNMTDEAFLMFSMEGRVLLTVFWKNLKEYFVSKYMERNFEDVNVWRINIYSEYIKVGEDSQRIPVKFEYL